MMRRKKLVSLAMYLAAFTTLLYFPSTANAATSPTQHDAKDGPVQIFDYYEDENDSNNSYDCLNNECRGHIITATDAAPENNHTIVIGGAPGDSPDTGNPSKKISHTVTLRNVKIKSSSGPALTIQNKAEVTLILEGINSLEGAKGSAGIYVEDGSAIIIESKDKTANNKLTAKGGDTGAGIGGQSASAHGDITINSGTIEATGGVSAAGIGCGSEGAIGNITITGGKVTAIGGQSASAVHGMEPYPSGSGIGYGGKSYREYASGSSDPYAKTILSGGEIIAYGGAGKNGMSQGSGIDCPILESGNGSTDIVTNELTEDTFKEGFSGIVWNKEPTTATTPVRTGDVYGNASLKKDVLENEELVFQEKASLLIVPSGNTSKEYIFVSGSIKGDDSNSIINRNLLKEVSASNGEMGAVSQTIKKKVVLIKEDLLTSDELNLIYTAKSLTEDAFKLRYKDGKRPITVGGKTESYEIDSPADWIKTVKRNGRPVAENKMIDQGTYTIECSNPKYPSSTAFNITIKVAKRDISTCKIADIPSETYNGNEHTPELTVTYDDEVINSENYTASYENATNVSNEAPAKVTITGQKNLTGSATKTFEITAIPLDNAAVTLEGETGDTILNPEADNFTAEYKGEPYLLNPTVTLDGSSTPLIKDTDYTVNVLEPEDAGTYTYIITGIGNYKGDRGEKKVDFTITPKPITIDERSLTTKTEKDYDTTSDIELTGIKLNVYPKDIDYVELSPGTMVMLLGSEGNEAKNVGTYNTITFKKVEDLILRGDKGKNYSLDESYIGKPLTVPDVTINPFVPKKPVLSGEPDDKTGRYTYTLTIKADPDNPEDTRYQDLSYECRMIKPADDENSTEDAAWQPVLSTDNGLTYTFDIPKDEKDKYIFGEYTFQVRSLASPTDPKNIAASETAELLDEIGLLDGGNGPEGFTLRAEKDPSGESSTIYLEQPQEYDSAKVIEYCIVKEGKEVTPEKLEYTDYQPVGNNAPNLNKITTSESSTTYVAYVRYKITDTRKPSNTTEITDQLKATTEPLYVKELKISFYNDNKTEDEEASNGGIVNDHEYLESAKVQIECETPDAEIYYTLDGTEPTKESIPYTKGEPFTISKHKNETLVESENGLYKKDTTVRAIAYWGNWEPKTSENVVFSRLLPQIPELELKLSSPTDKDPYSFVNTTTASLQFKTDVDKDIADKLQIYYIMATGEEIPEDPTTSNGTLYQDAFPVDTNGTLKATIKAIAIHVDNEMTPRVLEPITLTQIVLTPKLSYAKSPRIFARNGAETKENNITPNLEATIANRLKEEETNPDLSREGISDRIGQLLCTRLRFIGNYKTFEDEANMVYYDFLVEAVVGYDDPRRATANDFPEEGYTFTIDYPEGTDMESNDFVLVHMFEEGESIGKIEDRVGKDITKTPNGLQFTLSSASPIAIAWTAAEEDGPFSNNVGDGTNDPNEPTNPDDPNEPTNPDDPNTQDPTDPSGTDDNGATPRDGSDTNGTSGDGSATGSNGSNGTASVADAVRSAAATLLPKTGDTSKMVVWIVLAVACIAVIAGVQIKSKKGKGKKKH